MLNAVRDRTMETSTTTGTGAMTLAGAVAGYQRFTFAFQGGDATCYYVITMGTDWECGFGTFNNAANTLTRTNTTSSSDFGSPINWGAGTKNVFLAENAQQQYDRSMQAIQLIVGDETTAITTGTNKLTFLMPYAFEPYRYKLFLTTAQVGGSAFAVDLKRGANSAWNGPVAFTNGSRTAEGFIASAVQTYAQDDILNIDVTTVGDGTAKGFKLWMMGRPLGPFFG